MPFVPGPPAMSGPRPAPGVLSRAVRSLPSSCFALVMATGIVGVAAHLRGLGPLGAVLIWCAAALYPVLVLLALARLVLAPRVLVDELADPRKAFGHFTFVAGTNVLATCAATLGHRGTAWLLLALAGGCWLVLGYALPATLLLHERESTVLRRADGSWFLWTVASQSVSVVAATLEPGSARWGEQLAVVAVTTWSIGLALYVGTALVMVVRLLLQRPDAHEATPSWWISMGALAITVVAGARIVGMGDVPVVASTRPLVAGLAVILWSFASWLVPALVAAGLWRHGRWRGRGPQVVLRYETGLWSIVFPLGMYSVAGMVLGGADGLPFVGFVGREWCWVALTSWLAVAASGLARLVRSVRG